MILSSKYRLQQFSGVQRYSQDATKLIQEILGSRAREVPAPKLLKKFPNFYEQIYLPFFSIGRQVFNPTNSCPLLCGNNIVVIHDAFAFENRSWALSKYQSLKTTFLKCVVSRAKVIVTVSQCSKDRLKKYLDLPDRKIKILYPGVDEKKFYDRRLERENFVLMVGTISARKNYEFIFENWMALKEKFGFGELVVVSGSPLPEKYSALGGCGVRVVSGVSDEELSELYCKARLFISSSLAEGFNYPLAEALFSGLPVSCPNSKLYCELYGEECLGYEFNTESLIDCTTEALTDDVPNSSFEFQKFSMESMKRNTAELLAEIV